MGEIKITQTPTGRIIELPSGPCSLPEGFEIKGGDQIYGSKSQFKRVYIKEPPIGRMEKYFISGFKIPRKQKKRLRKLLNY